MHIVPQLRLQQESRHTFSVWDDNSFTFGNKNVIIGNIDSLEDRGKRMDKSKISVAKFVQREKIVIICNH